MISIVMAYYNRLSQLLHTLKSLKQTKITDFEVVIVSDFSPDTDKLLELPKAFSFPIRIIEMSKIHKERLYCNPCIPYNVGFTRCSGDKVIIQNPECCHVGDLLSVCDQLLQDGKYLSFSCYSASEEETRHLLSGVPISCFNNAPPANEGMSGWYNHPVYCPRDLHFTTAITKKDLVELGGFDQRFAHGYGYDDDEFRRRIIKKGLEIIHPQDVYSIHQYHYSANSVLKSNPHASAVVNNHWLFERLVQLGQL